MNDKNRRFEKKGFEGAVAVAFPMGNIVFLTHLANTETPYSPTHSQPIATAIRWLRAFARSGKDSGTRSEIWRKNMSLPFGQKIGICGE
jgi:hypothetical protein